MFFVFLWEREKQLDALFDGHAFNHSAGCQVDGCSDVPGMGMGSGQQTGVKLITGYKGGKGARNVAIFQVFRAIST